MTHDLNTFIRTVEIDDNRTLSIFQEVEADVGGVVWDSALVAAYYFIKNSEKYRNKKVLELGAGTGICGLVLAALGADVILTDLPSRVALLQKNYEINKSACCGSVTIQPLDWTCPGHVPDVDVLILIDCIYYLDSVDHLINTLNSFDAKEILCIYEKRDIGEPVLAQMVFLEKIVQYYDIVSVPDSDLHNEFSCSDEIPLIKLMRKYPIFIVVVFY
ncbi:hypothetical protein V3C99_009826 [Haemonchus contortus]|uniref:Protein-lysine methyltransferase METTL21D n=2 Tax=Haemonchus contortus TaxID=6289 RepID=A0A7I4YJC8_HAECO